MKRKEKKKKEVNFRRAVPFFFPTDFVFVLFFSWEQWLIVFFCFDLVVFLLVDTIWQSFLSFFYDPTLFFGKVFAGFQPLWENPNSSIVFPTFCTSVMFFYNILIKGIAIKALLTPAKSRLQPLLYFPYPTYTSPDICTLSGLLFGLVWLSEAWATF